MMEGDSLKRFKVACGDVWDRMIGDEEVGDLLGLTDVWLALFLRGVAIGFLLLGTK